MIPITVNGNTYRSIAAAVRAESPPDVSEIQVRMRLRSGWPVDAAFFEPTVPPRLRRTFKRMRS